VLLFTGVFFNVHNTTECPR